jgi:hypothetical protein
MARDLASAEKFRDLLRGDSAPPLAGDRSGRGQVKGSHGRSALNRVKGYLKNLVEAIAHVKLRRMRRELELHGIHLDQSDEAWIASSLRDDGRNR